MEYTKTAATAFATLAIATASAGTLDVLPRIRQAPSQEIVLWPAPSTGGTMTVWPGALSSTKPGQPDNLPTTSIGEVGMAKLNYLRSLKDGWLGPGSHAVTEAAVENYLLFLAHLEAFDPTEVEPMATRDGGIRLEWDRGDHSYVAELQGDGGLYMWMIGPDDVDTDLESEKFDIWMLKRFFEDGTIDV